MSRMIRFHKFGETSVLQCEEVATPTPGPGEVLVRVQALGLGWNDVLWRQNLANEQAQLPAGMGFELAGTVEVLGEGVDDLPVGTAIAAFPASTPNRYPAWGDLVLMPRYALTRYPELLTPVQAAVHYSGLLFGYFALMDLAQLKPGQHVLITEASRCLAPQTVQLAKALGAKVIVSTSYPADRDFLRELGADKVIVTEEQDLVLEIERYTDGKGVEVILDQCAGPQMKLLGDVAATRGKLILYGINGGNDAAFPACAAFKKHLQFFRHCVLDFTGHCELGIEQNYEAVRRALEHINQLTRDHLLTPMVDKVFAFDDFVAAHEYMETCPSRGRVALELPSA
ncbi:MAG: zinc-dependent alcohol dehydrogenase family protein [Gammaproteobacteria bacterium]|nr:zinc-dependent alcohol dehydrogenase family protein [Gammaproteobacteria bacterium]MBU1489589.1 zinc-dependent alcohol dehydrogenase family protein [Gammaproteobacteria bacterium]MBU2067792.1 zinc-dependent alcohol dehydrogenase family protein [Gammaproteobacteria bacterium]MBU2140975.1 zinc-dependent alcohol dehydrogenase family protein [Gammaproteobacteria bacterium]MBU2217394.1 zinc-dependent alcohol dehydrogenase family protein [Gammaproteobacteria bacterium]